MAEISKITLPSGNTYDIKDATAREMIAGGVTFNIAWDGTSTPDVSKIPAGLTVTYEGQSYTGTLTAASAEAGTFYLVKSSSTPGGQTLDIYDEYVPVGPTATKTWEKIGDTQVDLSDVVTEVTLNKQTTDVVTGYSSPTSKSMIGANATFSVTQPTITVTPAVTYLGATATGAAVGADGTANAITGFGAHTTDTFVKSVSAETNKKLVTTQIVPTDGTESVSHVTQSASKLVTTTIPNVTGNTNVSIPNVTGNTTVTANKSTWTFTMGSGTNAETLIIGGGNGSDVEASKVTLGTALSASKVTLGTAITAATGSVAATGSGTDIVTAVTISDKTVAKAAASSVTVATGATAATGSGDSIVTGVTIGSSASAITALGTPTTAAALTGVKVTAQPTIALSSSATAATGKIQVATGISSANATGMSVTWDSKDAANALTGLGTPSTASVLNNTTSITVTKGNA